jgi:hypothetical protein
VSDNVGMDEPAPLQFASAVTALARAWNRLDPDVVAPWLDDDVRYDSLETELSLQGRTAVLEHLRRKAARIDEAGELARIRTQLGWVASLGGEPRPCLIADQGGVERTALFLVTVTEEGLIARIEVCTRDPDPALAVGSGIVP